MHPAAASTAGANGLELTTLMPEKSLFGKAGVTIANPLSPAFAPRVFSHFNSARTRKRNHTKGGSALRDEADNAEGLKDGLLQRVLTAKDLEEDELYAGECGWHHRSISHQPRSQ
jgi:hypothetical protein